MIQIADTQEYHLGYCSNHHTLQEVNPHNAINIHATLRSFDQSVRERGVGWVRPDIVISVLHRGKLNNEAVCISAAMPGRDVSAAFYREKVRLFGLWVDAFGCEGVELVAY